MMFTNATKAQILDILTDSASRYLALFTELPVPESGSGGTEVSAGWYARELLDPTEWDDDAPTSEGAIVRRNTLEYTFGTVTGSPVEVVGWGIYDASSGGNLIAFDRIVGPEGGTGGVTFAPTQAINIAVDGIALVVGGDVPSITINVPGDGIVTFSAVITADYTASAGELVRYDASAAPYTIYAPSSPNLYDQFAISEVGVSSGSVTIHGNGSNIIEPGTTSVASFATTAPSAGLQWYYDGSVWRSME